MTLTVRGLSVLLVLGAFVQTSRLAVVDADDVKSFVENLLKTSGPVRRTYAVEVETSPVDITCSESLKLDSYKVDKFLASVRVTGTSPLAPENPNIYSVKLFGSTIEITNKISGSERIDNKWRKISDKNITLDDFGNSGRPPVIYSVIITFKDSKLQSTVTLEGATVPTGLNFGVGLGKSAGSSVCRLQDPSAADKIMKTATTELGKDINEWFTEWFKEFKTDSTLKG